MCVGFALRAKGPETVIPVLTKVGNAGIQQLYQSFHKSRFNMLERQGHRLLQLGIILLLFVCFEGFFIPDLASPTLGLSVHKLSSLLSVLMLAMGLLWPRLKLRPAQSHWAFWLLVYSSLIIDFAYVLAAVWGAGNETIRIAGGPYHGTALQETIIRILSYSSAPTGIIAFVLILYGLRIKATEFLK